LCSLIKEIHINESHRIQRDVSSTRSEADEHIFTKLRAVADQSNEKLNPRIIVWNVAKVIDEDSQQSLAETFPSSKLRIHIQSYEGSPIPYSPHLESIIAMGIHLHRDPLLSFRHILLNSPNMRKLHLAAYQETGCVRGLHRPNPPFLCLPDSETPNQSSLRISFNLEELSLTRFILQEDISFILQSRWTNLHSLNLHSCHDLPNIFRHLATKISICFPALRNLVLSYGKGRSDSDIYADLTVAIGTVMEAFVPGFEELKFVGPFAELVDIIAGNQSKSLIRLTVHDVEFYEGDDVRRTAPITAVEKLVERCDSLKELYLDANTVKRDQGQSDLSM
jgi:hypothetical protein